MSPPGVLTPLQGLPRRLALLGLLALGLGVAIGFGNVLAARLGPAWVPHAVGHASVAGAALLAAHGARRLARGPATARSRAGARLTLLGLLAVALSLLAEALAACLERDAPGALHAATFHAVTASFVAAFAGLAAWTYAGAREGALPRWSLVAVALVGVLLGHGVLRRLGLLG